MKLRRAEYALHCLTTWLETKHGINCVGIRLMHDKKQDKLNRRDPRAFCFVIPGRRVIHCAAALEELPWHALLGVLLHEIAHCLVREGIGTDPELAVDVFIARNFPETGYGYSNIVYAGDDGIRYRTARNIEVVSEKFASRWNDEGV